LALAKEKTMSEKSMVGDLINFRGLVYAPLNENGVVFLFGKIVDDLNMYIEEIKPGFPDCIARRFVGKGWERVAIEFEHVSSNFKAHGHEPDQCDIIVCWEHDWTQCPLEVIELKSEIQSLENYQITRPGSSDKKVPEIAKDIQTIINNVGAGADIKTWYETLFASMSQVDDSIWAKIGAKYIGWYCPEKSFVSLQLKKQSIRIECFSRGEPLNGTKVSSQRFAPRWSKFTIKTGEDLEAAIGILSESYKRIKEAIKAGEPTGYFSGAEPVGATAKDQKEEPNQENE
jgi:predicted transport protein